MAIERVIKYLLKYGWLKVREKIDSYTSDEIESAVKAYQAFHGLTVDGFPGNQTERSFWSYRFCGHPDVMPFEMEIRRWPDPKIRWYFDRLSAQSVGVRQELAVEAFQFGWKCWQNVCGILPEQVDSASNAHVVMSFGHIDGGGKVLAYSELADNTQNRKSQKYDSNESWVFEDAPGPNFIDLGRVAAHEIGHVLGLPHIAAGNLLQPTYDTRIRTPQAGDIREMVSRYGPPLAVEPPSVNQDFRIEIVGNGIISKADITNFRIIRMG